MASKVARRTRITIETERTVIVTQQQTPHGGVRDESSGLEMLTAWDEKVPEGALQMSQRRSSAGPVKARLVMRLKALLASLNRR